MPRILHILGSLLVTAIMSFLFPLTILGSLFLLLTTAQRFSGLTAVSQASLAQLQTFLDILGSGSPWQGCLVIGATACVVGVLFDTYALYRYQSFGHHESP